MIAHDAKADGAFTARRIFRPRHFRWRTINEVLQHIVERWLIELAADRTPYIDQATSLNLYIPADVEKWDLLMLHFRAWELGVKSLYYLRSKSIQRAGFAGGVEADNTAEAPVIELATTTDYDECLACQ